MLQRLNFGASSPGWTDERVELLKRLFLDGLSASAIAAELGGITRNAVIGKALRLGLKKPGKTRVTAPKARAPRKRITVSNRVHQGNRLQVVTREVLEPEPLPVELLDIPVGQRCSLVDLNDGKCRWPVGDPQSPEFFFSGGSPVEGLPYCNYHSRVAYQPAAARKDKRPHPFR